MTAILKKTKIKAKKWKKIELLNLGKLINREYIIEDNIQKGNTSDNFWYKKIKYVNKPYYLMTKTKLAVEKNIFIAIIIIHSQKNQISC